MKRILQKRLSRGLALALLAWWSIFSFSHILELLRRCFLDNQHIKALDVASALLACVFAFWGLSWTWRVWRNGRVPAFGRILLPAYLFLTFGGAVFIVPGSIKALVALGGVFPVFAHIGVVWIEKMHPADSCPVPGERSAGG